MAMRATTPAVAKAHSELASAYLAKLEPARRAAIEKRLQLATQ